MIDYKYPTIALGATRIGSAGRAPDKELLREERWRKFWFHYRWQAPENKLDISLPSESGFKNSTISAIALAKSKIEEIKDCRNWSLQKSKFKEVQDFKKSKFEEVNVWRSRRLKKLKFGDSIRVCNSSRVSGDTDVGMPLRWPSIPLHVSYASHWHNTNETPSH
jgi:hypothetical protein